MKTIWGAILCAFVLAHLLILCGFEIRQIKAKLEIPVSSAPCGNFPLSLLEKAKRFHGTHVTFCRNGRWFFPRNGRLIPLLETYLSLKGGETEWIKTPLTPLGKGGKINLVEKKG